MLTIDASIHANFASRLSHACDPNCVTAMAVRDGHLTVAVHTVRAVDHGEELTMDYNTVTDSEQEMRAAICLCGSARCRSTFLHFTGMTMLRQVLDTRHGLQQRFALLCRALSLSGTRSSRRDRGGRADSSSNSSSNSNSSSKRNRNHRTSAASALSPFHSDELRLASHGLKSSALGNLPAWGRRWAALVLEYVELEKELLPGELVANN
jgi:SET domain-containing protein